MLKNIKVVAHKHNELLYIAEQDKNRDLFLKTGIDSPGESVSIIRGKLGLSNGQNIFLCESDGFRNEGHVVLTLYNSENNGKEAGLYL